MFSVGAPPRIANAIKSRSRRIKTFMLLISPKMTPDVAFLTPDVKLTRRRPTWNGSKSPKTTLQEQRCRPKKSQCSLFAHPDHIWLARSRFFVLSNFFAAADLLYFPDPRRVKVRAIKIGVLHVSIREVGPSGSLPRKFAPVRSAPRSEATHKDAHHVGALERDTIEIGTLECTAHQSHRLVFLSADRSAPSNLGRPNRIGEISATRAFEKLAPFSFEPPNCMPNKLAPCRLAPLKSEFRAHA